MYYVQLMSKVLVPTSDCVTRPIGITRLPEYPIQNYPGYPGNAKLPFFLYQKFCMVIIFFLNIKWYVLFAKYGEKPDHLIVELRPLGAAL